MTAQTSRPNFVFILADDLGYADLGCYGARHDVSPVLDGMARDGLRFTDGYANSALCSPSRFALITGRYQYRLRGAAEEPLPPSSRGRPELGLPPEHPTWPSLLRDAGYSTALVGKWHLGYPPYFGPLKSGYQEFFGAQGGGIDYFSHVDNTGRRDLFEGDEPVEVDGYVTDLISDRAVDCIRRFAVEGQPFGLSVHYTAPHWPWESRNDEDESRRIGRALMHYDGGSRETYEAMVRHMDEGIGRILAALQDSGAADNTLVVFTSDNGGERYSDTWPLVGRKMDLLEGGIRVPLIARWPAMIAPGGVTAQVALSMDWMATMLAAAGVEPHPRFPLDGLNLLPVLRSPSQLIERDVFWRMKHRQQRAARSGRWKYFAQDGHEFLFDVVADPRERANLARREPSIMADMRRRFEAWDASMPEIPPDSYVGALPGPAEMARPTP